MTMKKTLGRRKVEMKKIENKSTLQVTFSKRKGGLFKKASELAIMCGAEIAILVKSPAGKIYAFEQPSVETLINRASLSPAPLQISTRPLDDYSRRKHEYDEAVRVLKAEEDKLKGGGRWWEAPVEGLGQEELEKHLASLEGLRENIAGRLGKFEEKATTNSAALTIQDYGYGASTQDWGFEFGASTQDLGFGVSTSSYADQDLGLSAWTSSYADQDLGFSASTLSYANQDLGFCASSPSYAYQDLSSIFN